MAQRERKIIEEGDHDLYIQDAAVWISHRETQAIKVAVSLSPRGKPVAWVYLFAPLARLWAVQLAEYCVEADLPWPHFRQDEDIINVLKSLKRNLVCLRVQVIHRLHKSEDIVFTDTRLLRPNSGNEDSMTERRLGRAIPIAPPQENEAGASKVIDIQWEVSETTLREIEKIEANIRKAEQESGSLILD